PEVVGSSMAFVHPFWTMFGKGLMAEDLRCINALEARSTCSISARFFRPDSRRKTMASTSAPPVDLYIAAYPDPDAAREDWDALKQLAKDDMIKVDGLILVSRRADGKIHVEDDFHETRKGAKWGAVGGAVVGVIFPPAL